MNTALQQASLVPSTNSRLRLIFYHEVGVVTLFQASNQKNIVKNMYFWDDEIICADPLIPATQSHRWCLQWEM